MAKTLAKYIKGYKNHVIGDIQGLEPEAFKELQVKGIVQEYISIPVADKEAKVEAPKAVNLKEEKLEVGKVDVVVPTKKKTKKGTTIASIKGKKSARSK